MGQDQSLDAQRAQLQARLDELRWNYRVAASEAARALLKATGQTHPILLLEPEPEPDGAYVITTLEAP